MSERAISAKERQRFRQPSAEDILRLRERELVEAHRIAKLGTWRWDIVNDTVTWSDEAYRVFRRDPALPPPTAAEHLQILTLESWEWLSSAVKRTIRTGQPYEVDLEMPQPDGPSRWITARGEVEARRNGVVTHLRGTLQEVTERKLAEERLARSLEESQALARVLTEETRLRAIAEAELSAVLRRTVLDQEAERLRIARELHDTLGQSLTLLQLGLDALVQSPEDEDSLRQRVAALKRVAADVGREVGRLAWEIRPTAVDDLGLQTAVHSLLERWREGTKIRFDLHIAIEEQRLPIDTEMALYRVLQEALTNVVRHSGATKVAVILTGADRQVTMVVEDDGRGFDDGETDRPPLLRRLGLVGMRERLLMVGGSIEWETSPGQGTTLFVRVPV
jgi:signal transduction histidine kinase